MSFLYFIPGRSSVDKQCLIDLGLSDIVDAGAVGVVYANGPDGGSGIVLCDSSADVSARVSLAQQTWRAGPKRGADVAPYWLGYWNSNILDPAQ